MEIVNNITEAHVAYWQDQHPQITLMVSPPGENCSDCSAIVTRGEDGTVVRVAWKPDEIDLAHLARGGTIWLSCWGGLPPHMLEVQEP